MFIFLLGCVGKLWDNYRYHRYRDAKKWERVKKYEDSVRED